MAEFVLFGNNTAPVNWRQFILFAYDPVGNQVLSANTAIAENADNDDFEINRTHISTIYAAKDVEIIRRRKGNVKCHGNDGCWDTSWLDDSSNKVKNESFTLMDGVANQVFDVLDVAPFEVSEPATPFAAPSDTISDQTGILATDVTAPVTVLPDTTEVTQPTDDSTTAPSIDWCNTTHHH